jgi:hypothetical protein
VSKRSFEHESLLVLLDLQMGAKINHVAGCAGKGSEKEREEIRSAS